jgi:hypothetical protein
MPAKRRARSGARWAWRAARSERPCHASSRGSACGLETERPALQGFAARRNGVSPASGWITMSRLRIRRHMPPSTPRSTCESLGAPNRVLVNLDLA